MGSLKVGRINLNDAAVVIRIRDSINQLVQNQTAYYPLRFKPNFYFETPDGQLPSERGWYIILDGQRPLYAGKAEDLNARLNSNNGSIDNFANKKRTFDPERNFIKKFNETKILQNLRVCIINEMAFCLALGIDADELTELDRGNIEKTINLFKAYFGYL
jgi:hypothetical protein